MMDDYIWSHINPDVLALIALDRARQDREFSDKLLDDDYRGGADLAAAIVHNIAGLVRWLEAIDSHYEAADGEPGLLASMVDKASTRERWHD
ncbi:hypothetical protein KJZ00_10495 [Cutibacterium avidum]|uniref:hypothetical protein n=1 Tax=Cutibacterium avidum TaxID=33010 RepID=UPI000B06BC1F|nr:hypothetical protein [Cutibacterium avidum]MDU1018157.1 hypothetical protein [Clostridium perfringens]MCO6658926.1 hypothetical protein [Cutibacterium avidum]MCO6661158.1 hypothetical protein [Cutibacterium avidum]MDQ9049704.1 hypothetical protein [Cutibacterium avidum]MDQ9081525.1 hypothetical protein [Cutibacterium avidum]